MQQDQGNHGASGAGPKAERAGMVWLEQGGPDDVGIAAWLALDADGAGGAWPTQTHAFVRHLAGSLLKGARIGALIARRPDGVIALCRDARYLARWRMPAARAVFEPGDGLLADPAAADPLAAWIAGQRRPVDLDRIPAASPLIPALRRAMGGMGLILVRPAVPCPRIMLDAGWCTPESRFNAGRRSDFRRAARRAQAMGVVSYAIHAPDPAGFDPLFDEAIAVEIAGWKREAETAIGSDPAKEAFFRGYFRDAAARGILRIAFLRLDGRAAAMQIAIQSGGHYWLFKIGYDEAYARCSPGTLLMLHMLGHAARSGVGAFELLGGVEPWIAQLWTRDAHPMVRLRTYPLGLRGGLALMRDGLVWLRQRLRR